MRMLTSHSASTAKAAPKADSKRESSARSSGCWSVPSSCCAPNIRVPMPLAAPRRGDGRRTRLPPVVLPVEQHSGRRAAGRGRAREAEDRGAGAAGAADARRSRGRVRWSTTSPASGCTSATCRRVAPERPAVPRLRRQPAARRSSARPSCSSRASCGRIAASLDLLTADYTFVNERLARHYGIPNVYGSHFRRVTSATIRARRAARARAAF